MVVVLKLLVFIVVIISFKVKKNTRWILSNDKKGIFSQKLLVEISKKWDWRKLLPVSLEWKRGGLFRGALNRKNTVFFSFCNTEFHKPKIKSGSGFEEIGWKRHLRFCWKRKRKHNLKFKWKRKHLENLGPIWKWKRKRQNFENCNWKRKQKRFRIPACYPALSKHMMACFYQDLITTLYIIIRWWKLTKKMK